MISGDFPPMLSGVGDYCAHVSGHLARLGHSVSVVTSAGLTGRTLLGDERVRVLPELKRWELREWKTVRALLPPRGGDFVVDIQYNCPATYGRRVLVNLLPLLITGSRPQATVVVTMHGFREQSRLFRLRAAPMLRRVRGIIYVERKNETPLRRWGGLPPARMSFIPIAGNIPVAKLTEAERNQRRTELGVAVGQPVIGFFGGIGRRKGFHILLDALQLVRSRSDVAPCLLAIGGFHRDGVNQDYQQQIQDRLRDQAIAAWVKIVSAPEPARVSELLQCADLAVFPFESGVGENSGSMMAALDHGLPTIATSGPANPPNFAEDFGVATVPSGDVGCLATMIELFIASPGERRRLVEQATRVVKERSWPTIAAETEAFLRTLLANRTPHRT